MGNFFIELQLPLTSLYIETDCGLTNCRSGAVFFGNKHLRSRPEMSGMLSACLSERHVCFAPRQLVVVATDLL